MHAVRLHRFGPPEALVLEELPDLVPGDGQVRIAVAASGVHLIDTVLRTGFEGGPIPPPELPTIPGREVAGTVDAVGSDVDESWLGRRVVCHLGMVPGGYASQAVVSAKSLHRLPDHQDFEQAVTMIGTGRSAVAILDVAAIDEHDVVLVLAAAGGLGSLFVSAAVAAGATVVGAASPGKLGRVRGLGADLAVDYTDPSWPESVRGYLGEAEVSVVLDGVGGDQGRSALELLGVGGRLVMHGWSSGAPTQLDTADLVSRGLSATWAVGQRIMRRPGALRELEGRALTAGAEGGFTVPIHRFPLSDAAAAHRALENRETIGKVVLTVG